MPARDAPRVDGICCREAKIKAIAYLSVFRVEETADVPHFASKFAAERMITEYNMPATILRPNSYMQSPGVKDALAHGVFPFTSGSLRTDLKPSF